MRKQNETVETRWTTRGCETGEGIPLEVMDIFFFKFIFVLFLFRHMRNGSRGGTRKGGGGCGPPPSTPPPPPQGLFFSMVPIDSSSSAHTCRPHFSPFSFLCFVAIFFCFFLFLHVRDRSCNLPANLIGVSHFTAR